MDRMQPQTLTAATYTLTSEGNSGTTLNLTRAAGITCTLPASVGDGSTFEFFVNTTVTSNSNIVKVANSTDVMSGVAIVAQDAADTLVAFETAATSDTITLNGTTTGGIKGDRIILKDVAAGFWFVNIIMSGTGTEATPFSATV
ncbi:hypothetical protein G9X67_34620 [Rhizobium sp. WYCCWR 11152]|uniref:hypothetical protein n=1 Tax=Rhizobium sp. WYCCWR 11152 TaxID=2692316 RepID=UPI0014913C5D|nr:hypothetical protein [Rhizobium sp. WYCCWR 11152]NNU70387.1 hypothetical protein [Rhizobium sp. WYCCWR 11152]